MFFSKIAKQFLLATSLLTTIPLAHADSIFGPISYYAGLDVGAGKRNIAFSSATKASITNFWRAQPGGQSPTYLTGDSKGPAGRIYFGIKLMPYLGVEMGYGLYNSLSLRAKRDHVQTGTNNNQAVFGNGVTIAEAKFDSTAIDMLVRVFYEFESGFGAFVKGGAAYDMFSGGVGSLLSSSSRNSLGLNSTQPYYDISKGNIDGLTGAYGAGLSYRDGDFVGVLGWTRFNSHKERFHGSDLTIPAQDFFYLGGTLHFE